MSAIQHHQSRIISAIETLAESLTAVDSVGLASSSSSPVSAIQLRNIYRRREQLLVVKLTIERCLEVLKERYESFRLFVRYQEHYASHIEELNRFWSQVQGQQYKQDAVSAIAALDQQLQRDENSFSPFAAHLLVDTVAPSLTSSSVRNIHSSSSPMDAVKEHSHQASQTSPSHFEHFIQLRKFEVPTFNGDLEHFKDFWCRFKVAVHDNHQLSSTIKFIYLANALQGSASLIVQGFDPSTPESCQLAVRALKQYYDRPYFSHNLYSSKLQHLPISSVSASSQRDTLLQIQAYLTQINRSEDTVAVSQETHQDQFPHETLLEVNRIEHRSGKVWTLPEFFDGLNTVIEELERLEDLAVRISLTNRVEY
ncbi:hypothetical protein OSTOST_24478 [Ostertagia ostertagi]